VEGVSGGSHGVQEHEVPHCHAVGIYAAYSAVCSWFYPARAIAAKLAAYTLLTERASFSLGDRSVKCV